MKKIHFAVFLVGLLLTSCSLIPQVQKQEPPTPAPPQEPTVQPVIEPEKPPVQEPAVTITPPVVEPPKPPQPQIPQDLKELLAKRTKTKSMVYDYKTTLDTQQYKVFIRGQKMKVQPASWQTLMYEQNYFTTVYIDISTHVALGYCDDSQLCVNYRKKGPFQVPFDKYYQKTPLDWASELEQGKYTPLVKMPGEVLVEERPTNTYRQEHSDGSITSFYVEKFYGIPLKVETVNEEQNTKVSYIYDSPAFNTLQDSNFDPPVTQ